MRCRPNDPSFPPPSYANGQAMAPALDARLRVVIVDAMAHKALAQAQGVKGMPTLILYQQGR